MNNNILAIAFLMAGTLLTTAVTTMVPAVYAEGDDHDNRDDGKDRDKDRWSSNDDDGNKNKAENESAAALADCDDNDVEQAGFDCIAVAEIED